MLILLYALSLATQAKSQSVPLPVLSADSSTLKFYENGNVCEDKGRPLTWSPYLCTLVPASVMSNSVCNAATNFQDVIDKLNSAYATPATLQAMQSISVATALIASNYGKIYQAYGAGQACSYFAITPYRGYFSFAGAFGGFAKSARNNYNTLLASVSPPMPVVVMLPGLYTMQDPNMQFSDKNGVCFNTGNYQTIWIPYLCSNIVPTSVISSTTCNTLSYQGIIDVVNSRALGFDTSAATSALALQVLLDLSNAWFSITKYYSNGKSISSCLFSQGSIDASTFPAIVKALQSLSDNANTLIRAINQPAALTGSSFPVSYSHWLAQATPMSVAASVSNLRSVET